jgi:hypothetical protein
MLTRRWGYLSEGKSLLQTGADPYYESCGERVLKLRRLGILPYVWITDSTRRRLKPSSWSGLEDFDGFLNGLECARTALDNAIASYKMV